MSGTPDCKGTNRPYASMRSRQPDWLVVYCASATTALRCAVIVLIVRTLPARRCMGLQLDLARQVVTWATTSTAQDPNAPGPLLFLVGNRAGSRKILTLQPMSATAVRPPPCSPVIMPSAPSNVACRHGSDIEGSQSCHKGWRRTSIHCYGYRVSSAVRRFMADKPTTAQSGLVITK